MVRIMGGSNQCNTRAIVVGRILKTDGHYTFHGNILFKKEVYVRMADIVDIDIYIDLFG